MMIQANSDTMLNQSDLDIVLINPRFEVSYWGLEHALPMMGKKSNLPVACLPLLPALTPKNHRITLVDENVEEIDYKDLATIRRFISDRGKTRSRRVTGLSRRHQSQLTLAVKRARELALLPYVGER